MEKLCALNCKHRLSEAFSTKKALFILKKFRLIILLSSLALLLSSCTSADKKVREDLEATLASLKNLDDEAVDELISEVADNDSEYKSFFSEMLKNLDYEIISVEKQDDSEIVIAELEFKTKGIDGLIDNFYQNIITKNIDSILQNQNTSKEDMNLSAIVEMKKEYTDRYLVLNNLSIKTKIEYKKIDSKWIIQNKKDLYNAVLGDFVGKSMAYKTEKLPTLFIETFLDRLKNISSEHIAILSGSAGQNESSAQFELYAKFYNNMDYSILETDSQDSQKTKFTLKIEIINPEKTFKDFGDKYVNYIKNSIDIKKSPTQEELAIQTYKLLMESIEDNKKNKISKESELIVTSLLDIENLPEFFKIVFDDVETNSANTTKDIAERIKNLYS